MYSITQGETERTPSRQPSFTQLERPFLETSEGVGGRLALPFLSEFDPVGVDVRFEDESIENEFQPTGSYSEAHRTVVTDELATNAVARALNKHFQRGMEN